MPSYLSPDPMASMRLDLANNDFARDNRCLWYPSHSLSAHPCLWPQQSGHTDTTQLQAPA